METTLILALLVLVISGVAAGTTGFGFALVSVPPLLLLYPPQTVVLIIFGASLLPGLLVVASARRETDLRLVGLLLPGALLGLLLGAQVLRLADPVLLKLIAGLFVAVYALLMWRGYRPPRLGGPGAASLAGLASGALGAATGLSGPPIVILFTVRQLARDAFRGTISAYFVVTDLIGLAILFASGTVGAPEGQLTLLLTLPAALGVLAGNAVARHLSPATFQALTLLLLLATGVAGMTTAIIALWG
ncbi:MAG: TSUP family transporter [Chloroflexota bacterium]|nr:TSUP family transporter [Chloroflexota bacterium]